MQVQGYIKRSITEAQRKELQTTKKYLASIVGGDKFEITTIKEVKSWFMFLPYTTSNGLNGCKRTTSNAQVDDWTKERKNETQYTEGCSSIRTILPLRHKEDSWNGTVPCIRGVVDGLPKELLRNRKSRIKALGNSIEILPFLKAIVETDKLLKQQ